MRQQILPAVAYFELALQGEIFYEDVAPEYFWAQLAAKALHCVCIVI